VRRGGWRGETADKYSAAAKPDCSARRVNGRSAPQQPRQAGQFEFEWAQPAACCDFFNRFWSYQSAPVAEAQCFTLEPLGNGT
jgi:hypothetical protein